MSAVWKEWALKKLDKIARSSLTRTLRPVVPARGSPVKISVTSSTRRAWLNASGDVSSNQLLHQESAGGAGGGGAGGAGGAGAGAGAGREHLHALTLFSTNDYLGLSNHPEVIARVCEAAQEHGMGPRSSPLVAGHTEQQQTLARELAELKGMEDSVIFPCGFAANTAVFSLLGAGEDVEVFSDELNHASIIDGLRLASRSNSESKISIYRHVDMQHLESLLESSTAARKIVVSDSLFSMDGDVAQMSQLLFLKERFNFLLALDDAHASLVYGKKDFEGADLIVGTMSKAFGAHGGFVCSSHEFVDLLVNMARPLIYSTALPDPVIAAARASLRLAEDRPWIRAKLWSNVRLFQQTTGVPASSPIVPILLGEEERALRASKELLLQGFHVPAIRPPTVKPGTARLRVALSAAHEEEDIVKLGEAMRRIGVVA